METRMRSKQWQPLPALFFLCVGLAPRPLAALTSDSAPRIPPGQQVWFAPNFSSPDLLDLFRPPVTRTDAFGTPFSTDWSAAQKRISVYQFFIQNTASAGAPGVAFTAETLNAVSAMNRLDSMGIEVGLEAGAIKGVFCRKPATVGATIPITQMDIGLGVGLISNANWNIIRWQGSRLRHLTMDEPLFALGDYRYGYGAIDGKPGGTPCVQGFSPETEFVPWMDQFLDAEAKDRAALDAVGAFPETSYIGKAAKLTVDFMQGVREANDSATEIGDIEPYPFPLTRLAGSPEPAYPFASIAKGCADYSVRPDCAGSAASNVYFVVPDRDDRPSFNAALMIAWVTQLTKELRARNQPPLAYFHLDVSLPNFGQAWRDPVILNRIKWDLAHIARACHLYGIRFGIVIAGNTEGFVNDEQFVNSARGWLSIIGSDLSAGQRFAPAPPAQSYVDTIIVQSWAQDPTGGYTLPRNLPQDIPATDERFFPKALYPHGRPPSTLLQLLANALDPLLFFMNGTGRGMKAPRSYFGKALAEGEAVAWDTAPVGSIDAAANGIVSGWAKDPDTASPIDVDLYVGGYPGGGGTPLGTIRADKPRADVGSHAFSFAIPAQYTTTDQRLFAVARNAIAGRQDTRLPGEGIVHKGKGVVLAYKNSVAGGFLDDVRNGEAFGWAADPDVSTPLTTVIFTVNREPALSNGCLARGAVVDGRATTTMARPDVKAYLEKTYGKRFMDGHGYRWPLPARFKTGEHVVYAYAQDRQSCRLTRLHSPMRIHNGNRIVK